MTRGTYLVLAIVPPRPLVTQTNKTARTYHGGAVSDLGLYAAVFLELDQIIERIPRPCTWGRERERGNKKVSRIQSNCEFREGGGSMVGIGACNDTGSTLGGATAHPR